MFKKWPEKKIGLLVLIVFFVGMVFFYTDRLHEPPIILAEKISDNFIDTGANNDGAPVINSPIFESVTLADTYLENNGQGIAIFENHQAKFYPFQILVWHYGVNDIWNGQPILVAYNPLCDSATVFKRTDFSNQTLVFENSGKIYNNQIIFLDHGDGALWGSLTGRSLYGLKGENQAMELVPSVVTTWEIFKRSFPNGQVLSRETEVERDYSYNPYNDYATSNDIFYPLEKYDGLFPIKTKIFTYDVKNFYPEDNIKSDKNTTDQQISFVWDEDWRAVRGYRISDGKEVGLFSGYWMCWAAIK
jgi:hypothetical protein